MEYINYFLKSKSLIEFLNGLKNNGLKQAYLFSSNDKLENYASCEILSLLINCKNNLCLTCDSCIKILSGNSIDLKIYPKNKENNILVEDIEEIIDSCYVLPFENEYKIYILNDFDKATISSQNKFLKTLEEPPKSVIFLLNSQKPEMILDTIKSRCEKIILPPLKKEEIKDIIITNNIKFDEISLQNCENEIGNYLTLTNTNFSNIFEFCLDMLKNMNLSSEILFYASQILKDKANLENYFKSLIIIFNDVLRVKYNENQIKNKSKLKDIILLSQKFSEKAVNEILLNIIKYNKALSFNTNENLVVDALLINILEEKHKWN